MRPGQKNRMRGGRGNNPGRRGPNPLTRSYESNGPDVKVRGTPQHIAEKYVQLARDAHSAGDTVMTESYLQHAEHYYRIIVAAQNAQQQAYNQANGIATTDQDLSEDEDEFEVAGADRFTFRTPQSFQPQPPGANGQSGTFGQPPYGQNQPYGSDPAAADQPPMPEGQPVMGEGGQPPFQQQPRGDRQQFGNRRFDERNNRRFGRDRNFGGDRPNAEGRPQGDRPQSDRPQGERNFGDRPTGERSERQGSERQGSERPAYQPRTESASPVMDEQPVLPSFITAPTRVVVSAEPEAPAVQADEGAPDAAARPRRRRRTRDAAAPPEAGEE
jgi:Domain of unknown function (DUF4167)